MKMFVCAVGVMLSLLVLGCTPQPTENTNTNTNTNDTQNDKDVTPNLVLKSGVTYYIISRIVDCELQQIIYYTGNGGISILSAYHNKRTEELYNKTCVGENK